MSSPIRLDQREAPSVTPFEYEVSTGNLWADLGRPDATALFLRVQTLQAINQIVTEMQLTPIQIAERLHVRLAEVSRLVNGDLRGFSLSRLLRFVGELGYDLRVTPVRRDPNAGVYEFDPTTRLSRKIAEDNPDR